MRRNLVAVLFLVLVAHSAYGDEPPSESVWTQGERVIPNIMLRSLDDQEVALRPTQSGVFLIHFWATWCGPCIEELPTLDRLAAELAPRGIKVLAVSEDKDGATEVRRFLDRHYTPDHLTVVLDPRRIAAKALQIGLLPITIIVGCDGVEHARLTGTGHWEKAQDRSLLLSALMGRIGQCSQQSVPQIDRL